MFCVHVCRLGRASVWQRLARDDDDDDSANNYRSGYRSSSHAAIADGSGLDLRVRLERKRRR